MQPYSQKNTTLHTSLVAAWTVKAASTVMTAAPETDAASLAIDHNTTCMKERKEAGGVG